jgi:hypothetical protein
MNLEDRRYLCQAIEIFGWWWMKVIQFHHLQFWMKNQCFNINLYFKMLFNIFISPTIQIWFNNDYIPWMMKLWIFQFHNEIFLSNCLIHFPIFFIEFPFHDVNQYQSMSINVTNLTNLTNLTIMNLSSICEKFMRDCLI